MSEYQRYEFMTAERPLARAQLAAVNKLSSHIEATSTHAVIEYQWGNFKHDPIKVLHEFFDGFLYWANWGAPELGLRFPHGILPIDLLDGYDLDEFVTFTPHPDCDILHIAFQELEAPDEWTEYELGSLMQLREELMAGDLRGLYIVWLAGQRMLGTADEEEDYEIAVPPVPPEFGSLTSAQQALAELVQVPSELMETAARHSSVPIPNSPADDFAAWVKLLALDRRDEFLVRLARNEPGLGYQLARELRELGRPNTQATKRPGKYVTFATLLRESWAIREQWEREKREREALARQRHLQAVHDSQDEYWRRVEEAAERGSGPGYDEAVHILIELRTVADHFGEIEAFERRFRTWVRPHLRRPALVKRLRDEDLPLPEV
jgi:hypothetical protein